MQSDELVGGWAAQGKRWGAGLPLLQCYGIGSQLGLQPVQGHTHLEPDPEQFHEARDCLSGLSKVTILSSSSGSDDPSVGR